MEVPAISPREPFRGATPEERLHDRLWDRAVIGLAGSAALLSLAAWWQARGGALRGTADARLVPAPSVEPPRPYDAVPPSGERSQERARQDEPAAGTAAIGYVFVARAAPEGESARHAEAIEALCGSRGMKLMTTVRDIESASGERRARPALHWALEQIASGKADALVVAELHQLAHTAASLPPILGWFIDHQRALVAIDVRLDTSTGPGRLAARALAHVGCWERERISAATRRGLAAARSGASAGSRAAVADLPELRDRIVSLRASGMTLKGIADLLNEEGVPTVRGGARWRPSAVQAVTGYRRPAATGRRAELPPMRANGDRPASPSRAGGSEDARP